MTTVPAMCAGCGTPLELADLRIAAITSDGRVDLEHESTDGRCGPAIVDALRRPDERTRLSRHRAPGSWSAEVLDRVMCRTLEAANEALTQSELAQVIQWPSHVGRDGRRTLTGQSLLRLVQRGVVTRSGRGFANAHAKDPYRYAIKQRGAA